MSTPAASKAFGQATNMRNRNDDRFRKAFQHDDEKLVPISSAQRDTSTTAGIKCGFGSLEEEEEEVIEYVDHFYSPVTKSGME